MAKNPPGEYRGLLASFVFVGENCRHRKVGDVAQGHRGGKWKVCVSISLQRLVVDHSSHRRPFSAPAPL